MTPKRTAYYNRQRMRLAVPTRRDVYRMAVRFRRFFLRSVLHADDPPHRLALGVAIGLFVTFTPTIGFQLALVVLLAWIFNANKVVGLPLVWLSNPATFVPIYYPCYRIGRWILGGKPVSMRWWRELASPPEGILDATRFYWSRLVEVIGPLTVGCLVVAIPIGGLGYVLTYQSVNKYRALRAKRLAILVEKRQAEADAAETVQANAREADAAGS
jgi:uncharacterized protein